MATIRQHGNGWQAMVRKRGTSVARTFSTKTLATAWATKTEAEIEKSYALGIEADTGMLLAEMILAYTAAVKPHKRWSKTKSEHLRWLAHDLGRLPVSGVTDTKLMAWARGWSSMSSAIRALMALSSALQWAADNRLGRIDAEAARKAVRRLKSSGEVSPARNVGRRVSDAEIERVKVQWESRYPFDIVLFAVATGMRLGEICALRWDDLDGSVITIRDRKDPVSKQGNDQRVPLPGDAPAIIARQPKAGPRIFPYSSRLISDAFSREVGRAGLAFRFHDLRHEAISRLFERGLAVQEVALISGHRHWGTLARYTHPSPEAILSKLSVA